jgi:hypothetical protein
MFGYLKVLTHGNHCNVRTIFKTEHTLYGILLETGFIRDADQARQCVYNISCDCDICYTDKTSGPFEVRVKGYCWKLDLLEMLTRQGSMFIIFLLIVIVTDVTLAKQVDLLKYLLGSIGTVR